MVPWLLEQWQLWSNGYLAGQTMVIEKQWLLKRGQQWQLWIKVYDIANLKYHLVEEIQFCSKKSRLLKLESKHILCWILPFNSLLVWDIGLQSRKRIIIQKFPNGVTENKLSFMKKIFTKDTVPFIKINSPEKK